jgi:hypothetical protein
MSMMSCQDISKVISDSLEHKLPLRIQVELHMHLMMCTFCRTYRKKTFLMRRILHADPSGLPAPYALPATAATRIQQAIDDLVSEK